MKQYEEITLLEDIMIPKGTEMVGKVMISEKDIWIEKGDSILLMPDGLVVVISRTVVDGKRGAFDITHKQYAEAIWNTALLAKHTFKKIENQEPRTTNNDSQETKKEIKIISLNTKDDTKEII